MVGRTRPRRRRPPARHRRDARKLESYLSRKTEQLRHDVVRGRGALRPGRRPKFNRHAQVRRGLLALAGLVELVLREGQRTVLDKVRVEPAGERALRFNFFGSVAALASGGVTRASEGFVMSPDRAPYR